MRFTLCFLLMAFIGPSAAPTWGQGTQYPPPVIPEDNPFRAAQPPTATLDGTIQPHFDPYDDSPLAPTYPHTENPYLQPGWPVDQIRVVQQIKLEYTLLGDNGGTAQLGLNALELSGSFHLPLGYQLAPLVFTPGFGVEYWEGPLGTASPFDPDLPPRTYQAYLDIGWQPQLTPRLAAELGLEIGVYSDFEEVDSEAIRLKSRGLVLYALSPRWQLVGGLLYLDRNRIKLLPAGGAIWMPNPDVRWEILFPQPKLAQRLTTYGNTELWWYVAGEYGGDAWQIERASGATDEFDYNDLRLIGGLEWKPVADVQGLHASLEIGYVFDRELFHASGLRFNADDTLMLRFMIAR
jgi:hypothetical protein